MNYRHAFHAGSFADVLKHVVLARILLHLREKPAPFRVIDTHAGAGLYDLSGPEASLTGEWRDGIGRLAAAALPSAAADLAAPYLAAVSHCNLRGGLRFYPGSPLIARALLRPHDRLIACEFAPDAATALAGHLRAAAAEMHPDENPSGSDPEGRTRGQISRRQVKVLPVDGWIALNAYVPVKERRGLVLLDPPYEQPDDFIRLSNCIMVAHRKWPTGIYMLWYPIKSRDGPDSLAAALRGAAIANTLRVELTVAVPSPAGSLGGCGVMIINPPWKLVAELEILMPALVDILGRDTGRSYALDRLDRGRIEARNPGRDRNHLER
jgi:23S rRNA (adenine2030-N6)-methyltransferase